MTGKQHLLTLYFLSFLLACSLSTSVFGSENATKLDKAGRFGNTNDQDDDLQENPDYDPREQLGNETKAAINDFLLRRNSLSSKIRRTVRLIRKHRILVILGITLAYFQPEVKTFVQYLFTTTIYDTESGKVMRITDYKPLHLAKYGLVLIILLQMRSTGSLVLLPVLLFLLGGTTPAMLSLSWVFSSSSKETTARSGNSAHLPPVKQHYSFERLNDRYQRDGMALRKAKGRSFALGGPASMLLGAMNKSSSLAQFIAQAAEEKLTMGRTHDNRADCNGTVVVMDMTNLDTTVKQLDTIRDQVSFLLHEYRHGALQPAESTNTTSKTSPSTGNSDDEDKDDEVDEDSSFEVVILLESPGGAAGAYAIAAQQILRLRNAGIKVTICVDTVAASGTVPTIVHHAAKYYKGVKSLAANVCFHVCLWCFDLSCECLQAAI